MEQPTSHLHDSQLTLLKVLPVAEDTPVSLRTAVPSDLLSEHLVILHLHYIRSHNNYTYSKLLKYS